MPRSSLRVPAAVAVVFGFACGGASPGLNQTSVTCPAGRTLLDGVCVAEGIADYVACVRAQGAQLGGSKGQKVSADVGTLGMHASGAAEVRESLEKKYSVSDAATLEIIKACKVARSEPTTAAAGSADQASGQGHELFYDGKRVGVEPQWSAEQSTKNCVDAWHMPQNANVKVECAYNGKRYAPYTPGTQGVAVKGYELMYDGKRQGYEPTWSKDQALENCKAALKSTQNVKVECTLDGKRIAP